MTVRPGLNDSIASAVGAVLRKLVTLVIGFVIYRIVFRMYKRFQKLRLARGLTLGATAKKANRTRIYALVIGINKYQLPSHFPELHGAVKDAEEVVKFLVEDMDADPNYVKTLLDDKATRKAIIEELEHLSRNPEISKGDPIFIYFAGHGTEINTSTVRKDSTGVLRIQAICPYDQGIQESSGPVYPIPDWTIRHLLNQLKAQKGDNITLVFDSCHSAGGNRTQLDDAAGELTTFRARGADFKEEIPRDPNNSFFAHKNDTHGSTGKMRGIQPFYTDQASHVFLAACGSDGYAWESNGRGEFTKALLRVIRDNHVDDLTYENLLKMFPELPHAQAPHCFGTYKYRVLFNKCVPLRRMQFTPVYKNQYDEWVLGAGQSSGVLPSSCWALYSAATTNSLLVGKFHAGTPAISYTPLKPEQSHPLCGVPDRTTHLYAHQIQAGDGHEMRVHITAAAMEAIGSSKGKEAYYADGNSLDGPVTNGFRYCCVSRSQSPDMVLDVHRGNLGEELTLTPRELLDEDSGHPLATKRIAPGQAELDTALFSASRWNHTLRYKNPSERSDSTISLEFAKLGEFQDQETHFQAPLNNLNVNKVIELSVSPNDQSEYGIRLINCINRPLHVRVLYFDVTELSVVELGPRVSAGKWKDAEIPAKGQYLIGDSANGGQSITMKIAEAGTIEVGFIKVVWSTSPFEIETVRGLCANYDHSEGSGAQESWGTLMVKLVLSP